MRYTRLVSDKNGESRFEQAALDLKEADYRPPAPLLFVSHAFEASGLQFVRLPAGWIGDSIHPPKRQFLICLQGELEVTSSDGKRQTFSPGNTVLMEDVGGKGHRTCVKGAEECIVAVVPLQ